MTLCWKERTVVGEQPPSRGGHTLSAVRTSKLRAPSNLVHFGGADAFGVASNDVHLIDTRNSPSRDGGSTATMTAAVNWRSSKALHHQGPLISARMGHTAVSVEDSDSTLSSAYQFVDRVVVFGGSVSIPEPTVLNDVWQLRIRRSFVRRGGATSNEEVMEVEWQDLSRKVTGDVPAARHAHSVASVEQKGGSTLMFVAGGVGMEGHLADAYCLDLATLVWTRVATHTSLAREMGAMAVIRRPNSSSGEDDEATVILTGGRDPNGVLLSDAVVLRPSGSDHSGHDSKKRNWLIQEVVNTGMTSTQMSGRCCHALLVLSESVLMPVGGFVDGPDQYFDCLLGLDLGSDGATASSVAVAAVNLRRVDTRGTEFMLGIGQSSASWQSSSQGRFRHCVFSGIFPNAVAHSNSVYELAFQPVSGD